MLRILSSSIGQEKCRDELPHDWISNAKYQAGVSCDAVNCGTLADHDGCGLHFSIAPLSNCVKNENRTVSNFCKKSCNNCCKSLKSNCHFQNI